MKKIDEDSVAIFPDMESIVNGGDMKIKPLTESQIERLLEARPGVAYGMVLQVEDEYEWWRERVIELEGKIRLLNERVKELGGGDEG